MDSPKTLAERLRWARERAGHSARGLDNLAKITPGHTTLIESGRRADPSGKTLGALALALGVTVDWLLRGEHDSSTNLAAGVEHKAAG